MIEVLFVDDEPAVLEGLENQLRPLRHHWAMTFAEGGAAAVELLEAQQFDVVVTDLRMPGVDGAAVLAQAREHQPQAIRFVLSGEAAAEKVAGVLPLAHRVLSKPCSPQHLRTAVEGAVELRASVDGPAVRALIATIDSLPPVPRIWTALSQLRERDFGVAEVAAVVGDDPVISGRLLGLANSAQVGAGRTIRSVRDAIQLLGVDAVHHLVLSLELGHGMSPRRPPPPVIDEIAGHALRVSRVARAIGGAHAELAAAAAVLHDLGRIVMVMGRAEAYRDVEAAAAQGGVPRFRAELDTFGTTHAEVGAHLLALWGVPPAVVEAVAYHHSPERIRDPLGPAGLVYLADRLANDGAEARLDPSFVARDGVAAALPRLVALARPRLKELP
jgi:putative nucleotidyltransferase with HDIG domain